MRNGGPAFPFEYHNQTRTHQEAFFDTGMIAPDASQQFCGMSLRDYFAAKAMQGWLAKYGQSESNSYLELAKEAYTIADSMLIAREKA
jgi:hypothetical protein